MALSLISKSRGHRIDGTADKQQNLLHILAKESVGQQCNKVSVETLSLKTTLSLGHPCTSWMLTCNAMGALE